MYNIYCSKSLYWSKSATDAESNPNQEKSSCEVENELVHLEVGHWVVVDYNGDQFDGEITSITGNDYKVNVMHQSGNYWKWSNKADDSFINSRKLSKLFHHCVVVGSCEQNYFQN